MSMTFLVILTKEYNKKLKFYGPQAAEKLQIGRQKRDSRSSVLLTVDSRVCAKTAQNGKFLNIWIIQNG